MKTFCEIIRELREDRDLKQADVAKVLGTSQQYYSKYETGKYEMPIHCVTALADFYGVSTDYILGRSEYSVSPSGWSIMDPSSVQQTGIVTPWRLCLFFIAPCRGWRCCCRWDGSGAGVPDSRAAPVPPKPA